MSGGESRENENMGRPWTDDDMIELWAILVVGAVGVVAAIVTWFVAYR